MHELEERWVMVIARTPELSKESQRESVLQRCEREFNNELEKYFVIFQDVTVCLCISQFYTASLTLIK